MPERTWVDILRGHWPIAAVAFGLALLATPLVRLLAYRLGVVDRPDALLKPHRRPVAYLGGVGICLGILAGLAAVVVLTPGLAGLGRHLAAALAGGELWAVLHNPLWNLLAVALGCVVITVVGLLDDVRGLRPRTKVAGQLLAAIVLLIGGVGHRTAIIFLEPVGLADVPWLLYPLSAAALAVLVIAVCNASNLLDGLDGLCSGVTAIVALGSLALAVWLAMWPNPDSFNELRVGLALATVGAVLGFLPYNLPPASIFMGDAGSMLLGFFVAAMTAMFAQQPNYGRWLLGSLVVFAIPITDTALAVVRRRRAGRSIFTGDRSHLYDQLVDRGMSVRRVVMLFYAMSLAAAVLGVGLAIFLRLRYAAVLCMVLAAGLAWVLCRLGFVMPPAKPADYAAGPGKKGLAVLFSSVGRRVALVRAFREAARSLGCPLGVHAADQDPKAPALHEADVPVLAPPVSSGRYVDFLLEHCRRHRVDAVIPLIDPELPLLAPAGPRFAEAGTRLLLSAPQVVEIASDKIRTAAFLQEHGFATPAILSDEDLADASFPLFLKPRHGSASHNARPVRSRAELDYFRAAVADCVVQEYIEGVEYTVDVFADFEGRPRCAVPRRRHEVRGGEVSKGETVKHPRMMGECCRLVRALGGCVGMVTIQCFLTPDDRMVFIEINPRFGGGVPLSIRAGANSPLWTLRLLGGQEPQIAMDAWTDGLFMLRYDEAIFVRAGDSALLQD